MGEVADLWVRLSANTAGFRGAMAGAAAEGEKFGATIRRGSQGVAAFGVIGAAAVIGVGVKSIDMAMKFQAATERIRTQAGATQGEVNKVRDSIYRMAGQVGFGPDKLAEAFYHVESAGYRAAQATDIVRRASQLAKVGQSDLAETTNAVVGILQSGWVAGAGSAGRAVSLLNAIVGAGNMKMQDLVGAMSTGIAAASKTFGVSMQSSGAAIALMTDQGVPAQMAATHLRMAISLIGAPTKAATKYLTDMGISSADAGKRVSAMQDTLQKAGVQTTQLANDLRKPDGFMVALTDLKTHMVKAGISSAEQAAVISRSFGGGKSGAAIMQMYTNLDLLKTKFGQIGAGAKNFGADWQATQGNMQQQVDKTKARIESWLTQMGMKLLPLATKALGEFNRMFDWLGKHTDVLKAIGAAFAGVVATGLFMAATAAAAFMAPFLLVAVPIAAVSVGLYELYERSARFREIVAEVGDRLKQAFTEGRQAVRDFVAGFSGSGVEGQLSGWAKTAYEVGERVRTAFETGKRFIESFTKTLIHLWETSKVFRVAVIAIGIAIAALVAPFLTVTVGLIYLWNRFAWFRDSVRAVWAALKVASVAVWHAIGDVISWFANGPLKFIQGLLAKFSVFWKAHGQELITIASKVWTAIWTLIKIDWDIILAVLKVGLSVLKSTWKVAWDIVVNVVKTVWNTVAATIRFAVDVVLNVIGLFADLLTGHWSKLWGDVKKLVGDAMKDIGSIFTAFASGAANLLYQAGKDVINGMINGMKSMAGAAVDAVKGVGKNVMNGAKSILGIGSPSKVFHGYGVNIGEGLVNGMKSMLGPVTKAAADLGTAAATAHHKAINVTLTGLGHSLTGQSAQNQLLSKYASAKSHQTLGGQRAASKLWVQDVLRTLALDRTAHAEANRVRGDRNATPAERSRATAEAVRADKLLKSVEKMHARIDQMGVNARLTTQAAGLKSETLANSLLSKYISDPKHHTVGGQKAASALWVKDVLKDYTAAKSAHALAAKIARDPEATAAQRAKAAAEAVRADKLLAAVEKMHGSIEKMVTDTAAGRIISSHGRRLGARQALAEDLPTYLASMAAAGRAGSRAVSGMDAGSRLGGHSYVRPAAAVIAITMPVTVHMGSAKVHAELQRFTVRHENRNVNNGLTRHVSR